MYRLSRLKVVMKRQGGGGGEKELEYQYTAVRRRPQSAKKGAGGGRGAPCTAYRRGDRCGYPYVSHL